MTHLTNDVLTHALFRLRAVGCKTLNPLTLALASWEAERVESLKTAKERQPFHGLHLAACSLPGVEPHASDLRPIDPRDDASIDTLADAYKRAGRMTPRSISFWHSQVRLRCGHEKDKTRIFPTKSDYP